MPSKLTTEQFVARAREVHGERYDYSQVEYRYALEKVAIVCPEHGVYLQTPAHHCNGKGCPKCGDRAISNALRYSVDLFVEKACAVHGSSYDYSHVVYTNSKKAVCIICPTHGPFYKVPADHISGKQGCPLCGREAGGNKLRQTTERFIDKARFVHGDKYDYSQVDYQGARKHVVIICAAHGQFKQVASCHLSGQGCATCAQAHVKAKLTWTTPQFIEGARAIHGDKYDYARVEYKGSSQKIAIACATHGVFMQAAGSHLAGFGCSKCGVKVTLEKRGEAQGWSRSGWVDIQKGRKAVLYIIQANNETESFFKIGITYNSITHRFAKSAIPYRFRTVALYKSYNAGKVFDLEKQLHRVLKQLRHTPLLPFGGQTECFTDITLILPLLPPDTFVLKWAKEQLALSLPQAA